MRRIELREGFCLTGRINGASKPNVAQEVTLPFMLQNAQAFCGQEGVFLRSWTLHTLLEKPEEPPHSHAERTLLTLDGVYGTGMLFVGDSIQRPIEPHMVVDVTEALRGGSAVLKLCFPPQHPQLLQGERGKDLVVPGGLVYAELRNIYHLQIIDVCIDASGLAKIKIHAYGAGKIRLCLRLMKEETLLWTENCTVQLQVGDQIVSRKIETEHLYQGAVLRVTADMGGEGCDTGEAVCSIETHSSRYYAHFRALPTEPMLKAVWDAGFDTAVFYEYPHEKIRRFCKRLGLQIRWHHEPMTLNPLLGLQAEYQLDKEGCLVSSVRSEDDACQFRQAQRLSEAVFARRAAGKPVDILAWARQMDAQDGLLSAEEQPRLSLYALRNALAPVAVWACGEKRVYKPYEEFCESIIVMFAEPDGKPAVVQAQLYAWNGDLLAERVFPFCANQGVKDLGVFRARLPWKGAAGLLMRMQCIRDGKILSVNHVYYPCANENGDRLDFPEADLVESAAGELCNASDAAAMGISIVCDGKIRLCYGAMLPQERISIACDGEIVVKCGNTVGKGGKARVKQRILRCIYTDQHTTPLD